MKRRQSTPPQPPSRTWLRTRLACVLAIAAVLATLTWRQSREYVGAEVLYAATIKKNPDAWMAHLNLGWLRLQRGALTPRRGITPRVPG